MLLLDYIKKLFKEFRERLKYLDSVKKIMKLYNIINFNFQEKIKPRMIDCYILM